MSQILREVICLQQVSDETLCALCVERKAVIRYKQCKKHSLLCFVCDDIIHSSSLLHDRLFWSDNQLEKLTPGQAVSETGEIVDVGMFVIDTFI